MPFPLSGSRSILLRRPWDCEPGTSDKVSGCRAGQSCRPVVQASHKREILRSVHSLHAVKVRFKKQAPAQVVLGLLCIHPDAPGDSSVEGAVIASNPVADQSAQNTHGRRPVVEEGMGGQLPRIPHLARMFLAQFAIVGNGKKQGNGTEVCEWFGFLDPERSRALQRVDVDLWEYLPDMSINAFLE